MGTDVEAARAHADRRTLFLRQFHEPGFRDMLARLIDRTKRRIQSLSWMQVASGPAPAGKEAADMVHDVVAKALSDDDEPGPADSVLLEEWLWDRVSSKVSNFVRCYENRKRSRNYEPGKHPIYDDGDAVPRDERTAMREVR